MSRPIDKARPDELLDDVVRYLVRHGLADLSLRPLAKAIGSSPRVLLYYYGSRERMIARALGRLRERQRAQFRELHAWRKGAPAAAYFAIWKAMSAPASVPLFRLFFEVYGLALRHPRRFQAFLTGAVDDWLDALDESGSSLSRARATVVVAGFRGFMIDFLASHDRRRVDRAVKLWLEAL